MSIVINTKTYSADTYSPTSIIYVGPSRTVSVRDDLKLARTAPKGTATFSGVGRASAKLTRTLTLTNAKTLTGDAIVDIQVSVPVGFAAADVDTLLTDAGTYASSVGFKDLVKKQVLNF